MLADLHNCVSKVVSNTWTRYAFQRADYSLFDCMPRNMTVCMLQQRQNCFLVHVAVFFDVRCQINRFNFSR